MLGSRPRQVKFGGLFVVQLVLFGGLIRQSKKLLRLAARRAPSLPGLEYEIHLRMSLVKNLLESSTPIVKSYPMVSILKTVLVETR